MEKVYYVIPICFTRLWASAVGMDLMILYCVSTTLLYSSVFPSGSNFPLSMVKHHKFPYSFFSLLYDYGIIFVTYWTYETICLANLKCLHFIMRIDILALQLTSRCQCMAIPVEARYRHVTS